MNRTWLTLNCPKCDGSGLDYCLDCEECCDHDKLCSRCKGYGRIAENQKGFALLAARMGYPKDLLSRIEAREEIERS